jgi:general secretion pathway protein M
MEQLKALLSDLQTWLQGLTLRERRLVIGAGAALGLLVFFAIQFSFSNSAAGYRRRTEQKLLKLKEAQVLAGSYRESEQKRQEIERQLTTSRVSLISYLEEKGTGAGLSIATMNPRPDAPVADGQIIESAVELTLADIPINKLVDFLSAVEHGPGVVKVKYLRTEPRPKDKILTAWTTIATYRMKQ